MKWCIIQCQPYLSHAQSRNFAWHPLWLSTTEGKNIDKLLARSQTPSILQTDRQIDLQNFLKIVRLLGKIYNFIFWSKKSSSGRTCPYFQWIVCTIKKGSGRYLWSGGKTFTPCAARTIIFQREKLKLPVPCFFNTFDFYCWFVCRVLSLGRV